MKSPQAFRSIGEVARLVGVATHVLRYWETQFPALAPVRRPDGRRYYRPDDLLLAAGLCEVMREDGLTIRGAQRLIALDKGASLRDRGRLRLEAAAGRKAADAVAGRRHATASRGRAQDHAGQANGPALVAGGIGQTPSASASRRANGQAEDGVPGGFVEGPDDLRPVQAPAPAESGRQAAKGAASAHDGRNNRTPVARPDPDAGAWLGRLAATATALRAREQPLPPDARPLHDALRRVQAHRT